MFLRIMKKDKADKFPPPNATFTYTHLRVGASNLTLNSAPWKFHLRTGTSPTRAETQEISFQVGVIKKDDMKEKNFN